MQPFAATTEVDDYSACSRGSRAEYFITGVTAIPYIRMIRDHESAEAMVISLPD